MNLNGIYTCSTEIITYTTLLKYAFTDYTIRDIDADYVMLIC